MGLQERTAGAACEGRGKCSALKGLRTERFHCAEKKKNVKKYSEERSSGRRKKRPVVYGGRWTVKGRRASQGR